MVFCIVNTTSSGNYYIVIFFFSIKPRAFREGNIIQTQKYTEYVLLLRFMKSNSILWKNLKVVVSNTVPSPVLICRQLHLLCCLFIYFTYGGYVQYLHKYLYLRDFNPMLFIPTENYHLSLICFLHQLP